KETLIDGKILGTLDELKSKEAILNEVRKQAAAAKPDTIIFLRVAEDSPDALQLTRADLDPVSPKNPVVISVSSSDFIVNSLMLKEVIERIPMGEKHPGIV